jgi:hypothetical protein
VQCSAPVVFRPDAAVRELRPQGRSAAVLRQYSRSPIYRGKASGHAGGDIVGEQRTRLAAIAARLATLVFTGVDLHLIL